MARTKTKARRAPVTYGVTTDGEGKWIILGPPSAGQEIVATFKGRSGYGKAVDLSRLLHKAFLDGMAFEASGGGR